MSAPRRLLTGLVAVLALALTACGGAGAGRAAGGEPDPEAVLRVFRDATPKVVGLDVTEKTQCTPADFAAIAAAAPARIR